MMKIKGRAFGYELFKQEFYEIFNKADSKLDRSEKAYGTRCDRYGRVIDETYITKDQLGGL